ncbi:hypothetical protein [Thermobrachium celere]|uniref:hypothetical protein n=1 Tax=Thermobrachium celere TaxID=53422 RepID=UPI0019452905|nr:hypothetical protein [Thermobrachium celere]GFR34508.1 hypothetical protein TCEA9_03200 [Thermobrachium celere]
MKNKRYMFKDIFNEKIIKLIIFVITFIILFLISSFSVVPKKYSLKVGDIAPIDIKAPRDFEDEVATQEKINKALEGLSPKYNKDLNIAKKSIEDIESLINDIKTEKKQNIDDTLKIERLKSKTTLNITDEDIKYLLKLKEEELDILNEFFKNNLIKVLSQDIRENNLDDIKKAQQDLDFYIKSSNLPKNLRDIANTIGIISIKPNMFFDYQQTEDLKQQIKKQIDPVIIKKKSKHNSKR